MKRSSILVACLFLSSCSSNSQLNVVDGLTLVAANDGAAMNPARWMIMGHPLQTTYVSLNGQLGLKVGQVCIASRFRSPFTNNCRAVETKDHGSFYREYYSPEASKLTTFLEATYAEREAAADYVKASRNYYACVVRENANITQQSKVSQEKAVSVTQQQLANICLEQRQSRDTASDKLKSARQSVQRQTSTPNRIVYNWAESLKFEGGAVVKQPSNSVSGQYNKDASGYTIVNGLSIERYELTCEGIQDLRGEKDSERLKVVTMTLSADDLYYDAREDTNAGIAASFSFSPNELKTLEAIFESNVEVNVKAALASSTNLASSGYLTKPEVDLKSNSSNNGLTYYAVLTDLESFQCPD